MSPRKESAVSRMSKLIVFVAWLSLTIGFVAGFNAPHKTPVVEVVQAEHIYGSMPRSGKWPKVRAAHLEKHPTCAVCGWKEDLTVHHIKPFSVRPDLELDPSNLITLCGKHGCHLAFGHLYNYRRSNPSVISDAAAWLEKVKAR